MEIELISKPFVLALLLWYLTLFFAPVVAVRCGEVWSIEPRETTLQVSNPGCSRCTFIRHYAYRGYLPEVQQQIVEWQPMAVEFETPLC